MGASKSKKQIETAEKKPGRVRGRTQKTKEEEESIKEFGGLKELKL